MNVDYIQPPLIYLYMCTHTSCLVYCNKHDNLLLVVLTGHSSLVQLVLGTEWSEEEEEVMDSLVVVMVVVVEEEEEEEEEREIWMLEEEADSREVEHLSTVHDLHILQM